MPTSFRNLTFSRQWAHAWDKVNLYEKKLAKVSEVKKSFKLRHKNGTEKTLNAYQVAEHLGKWKERLKRCEGTETNNERLARRNLTLKEQLDHKLAKSNFYQARLNEVNEDNNCFLLRHKNQTSKTLDAYQIAEHLGKWKERLNCALYEECKRQDAKLDELGIRLERIEDQLKPGIFDRFLERTFDVSSMVVNLLPSHITENINYGLICGEDDSVDFPVLKFILLWTTVLGSAVFSAQTVILLEKDFGWQDHPLGFILPSYMLLLVGFLFSQQYVLGLLRTIIEKSIEALKDISELILSDRASNLATNLKQHIVNTIDYGNQWGFWLDLIVTPAMMILETYLILEQMDKNSDEIHSQRNIRGLLQLKNNCFSAISMEVQAGVITFPFIFLTLYLLGLVRTGVDRFTGAQVHSHIE